MLRLPLVLLFAPVSPADAHEQTAGDVTIVHPHARATVAVQENGAAYMVIRDRGAEPERLLAVASGPAQDRRLAVQQGGHR